MRRIFRSDLSASTTRKLKDEQERADQRYEASTLNVEVEWTRARHNKPLQEAFTVLQDMAGPRERCMYCGDSHGTDIEHFWPKAPYPKRMFQWPNLLLCCTACGRIKGAQFPLINELPALIDPSTENPWDFLDFEPQTGNIVARYDPERQQELLKGRKTVQVLQFDRREVMANGYKCTFRRIKRRIEEALEQASPDATTLLHDLNEADDHGLLGWCFDGLGSLISPFAELQARHPAVWAACRQSYQNKFA